MSARANQANQLKSSAFRSTPSSSDLRPGLYLLIRYSKGSIMVVVKKKEMRQSWQLRKRNGSKSRLIKIWPMIPKQF
ncbi:hypothetical protein LHEH8_16730 [Lactobacillus helveticus]|uniref:Uncharacterized protein n=1 Tax=Lactobacillus helveticus TaxID=1587 RepID=A0A8H9KHB8_LACHE|nr:hypothetical protein LHEH8_16730 [Lactobacillus helveticus]GFP00188.1 hypothetical protein LHEW6_00210 [Lactobacillus helveticus]GFP02449.1 hypothetical protein LHEY10_03780 [Lactobacillus helveticus]